MEYTIEEVDHFGDALMALPDIDPAKRKLDKQAAAARAPKKAAKSEKATDKKGAEVVDLAGNVIN